jgi:hypothetical protein
MKIAQPLHQLLVAAIIAPAAPSSTLQLSLLTAAEHHLPPLPLLLRRCQQNFVHHSLTWLT